MKLGERRTKTYIAGDWDGDSDAIKQLYEWKKDKLLDFNFVDVHDLTQSRDTSLKCTIKSSLKARMDISKTFVLIVGEHTKSVKSGSCYLCPSYNSYGNYCVRAHSINFKSFIEYECELAAKFAMEDDIKIVVLYNDTIVNRNKCPESLRNIGNHQPMAFWKNGICYWDFYRIKNAIQN